MSPFLLVFLNIVTFSFSFTTSLKKRSEKTTSVLYSPLLIHCCWSCRNWNQRGKGTCPESHCHSETGLNCRPLNPRQYRSSDHEHREGLEGDCQHCLITSCLNLSESFQLSVPDSSSENGGFKGIYPKEPWRGWDNLIFINYLVERPVHSVKSICCDNLYATLFCTFFFFFKYLPSAFLNFRSSQHSSHLSFFNPHLSFSGGGGFSFGRKEEGLIVEIGKCLPVSQCLPW
jgi:hypothetical protein